MHISYSLLTSIVAGSQFVSATPAGTPSRLGARADDGACAKAASASAAFVKASPDAQLVQIPAQTAYDCLQSVQLRKDAAVDLTKAMRPYVQLQSTVDYLRKPPSGYLWDPVDVPRLLDVIETKLIAKDTYDSEYDFQVDLESTLLKARDGHFVFRGDLVNTFAWLRPIDFNLVSLSMDGKEIPQVYVAGEVLDISEASVTVKDNSSASSVKKINDLDVETFFLADSNSDSAQDPDNSWNTRFFRIQDFVQMSNVGQFNQPALYPGPTTTIEFQNGTKITLNNTAVPLGDLDGISSGDDMYQKFCTGTTNSTSSKKRELSPLVRRQSTADSPYPQPVFTDKSGVLSGYYLDNSDVAVLAVSSFLPGQGNQDDLVSFQDTLSAFFADAVDGGKTKLVVDLQGNGGGALDLSIDMVAQLFPDVPPNSKDNMRASLGMHSIMLAASNLAEDANKLDAVSDAETDYAVVPFAFQEVMTPDVKNFNRLQDYYGPSHVGSGFFTNFFQGNYTNDSPSQYGLGGITITGQDNRTEFKQPFKADDIIMVTDGVCASACTIFSEHMKQRGVQVIAMGGRPQTGPMQAVGGTKGSQVFEADNIDLMLKLFSDSTLNTDLGKAKGTVWEDFSSLPINRTSGKISINGRNQFRIGDDTQTPLQFVYEAADCRIYQTPEMAASPVAIWERVASLAFDNRKDGVITSDYCVKDSTKHPTSLSGGLSPGSIGPQTPPANAKSTATGFLVNGKDIVTSLASGEVSDSSPVDPTVAAEDGAEDTATSPDVLAAVDTMNTICQGYTGKEWFVQLLCGALMKQSGGS